jgi:predicted GIY-YIG superfamily endonuclease
MEKIWTVYILQCGDGSLYTGITDDLERRFRAHEAGKGAKYTRGRGPLKLCYREEMPDKGSALRREAELKRLRRSRKLDLIHKKELKTS